MKVLIVSKTHMNQGKCCVGGITDDGESIRLLTADGENQPENTDLAPGLIYDMEFKRKRDIEPPHIEDVLIQSKTLSDELNEEMIDFLEDRDVAIWQGGPEELFDGKLQWTDNGSGYINEDDISDQSVGFWVPNQSLKKSIYYGKVRYSCKVGGTWYSLPYIGYDEPVDIIPAGTLIRVSLARWWDTNGETELRCSLQLSGWYDL